jgi:hypothetical protein
VKVDEEDRLDLSGQVADDRRLGGRVRHEVPVEVEVLAVRTLSDDAAVRVQAHREVQAVVLEHFLDGGVILVVDEVLDVVHAGIGSLPLVAVDVPVEPDRALVPVGKSRVVSCGCRVVLDLVLPRLLLRVLRGRLRGGHRDEIEVPAVGRLADDLGRDVVALIGPVIELGRDLVVCERSSTV